MIWEKFETEWIARAGPFTAVVRRHRFEQWMWSIRSSRDYVRAITIQSDYTNSYTTPEEASIICSRELYSIISDIWQDLISTKEDL
jgi:hypothetical protein